MQLALPFDARGRRARRRLDEVRDRFGSGAITRGVLLGRDPGIRCRCCPTEGPTRLTGPALSRCETACYQVPLAAQPPLPVVVQLRVITPAAFLVIVKSLDEFECPTTV